MAKQSFDIDDDFFVELEQAIKGIADVVKSWKEKDKALGSLAEQQVNAEGIMDGEDPDAKIFSRRKMLKKTLQDNMKSAGPAAPGAPAAPMGPPPGLPPMPPPEMPGGIPPLG